MSAVATRYRLAEVGALFADPARAGMLLALMDGAARPAGELGQLAGIAAATASVHLRKLVDGGLLAVVAQGRHRYYRLAGEEVAHLVETLGLDSVRPLAAAPTRADAALRHARTCYQHLAGQLGVALFECLRSRDALRLDSDALRLSKAGAHWLRAGGLVERDDPVAGLAGRTCLDWTERRFHLAGPLGTHLARRLFDVGWLRRVRGSRALAITLIGRARLHALGVDVEPASRQHG